ncbi:universal stress protein [Afifella marina]|nr:universal stress protein [Afifella marina]MBK1623338.1 universal stress protein UspA [Afifella marina DSM 2698]MBK1626332.1 universal stress protein UspA [Afifella marina]MBK5917210.1 universal stress protein UspA [Afifella marina]RAI22233.1 universal stress protein UspA [Afifella marina DSM 2698]
MMRPRRARAEGHKRKFLVVIDDTPECVRAMRYAAKRAERTNGAVTMLFVIEPGDFQHWLGVEEVMRAEAMEEAENILGRFASRMADVSKIEPELVIREGKRADEIRKLIEEDEDIAILVLAASGGSEGPGPLVSSIAQKGGLAFPIPVTIVPENLSDEVMDEIV